MSNWPKNRKKTGNFKHVKNLENGNLKCIKDQKMDI